MRVLRSLLAAVIVVLLAFEIARAQAPSISPITISTPTPTISSNSLDQVVELTGQLDQRILTTVYWCLGTLVTVFLVLIGYNWFVNFRMHERDFRELRKDISTRVETAVEKIEAAGKAAGEQIKTDIRKSTEAYIESKIASVKSALDSLRSDLRGVEAKNLEQEVDVWLGKKVYSNALRVHIEYLRKTEALGYGYDWKVQMGLDKMERMLKTMIREEPGRRPNADDIADLSRFLASVAKQNPVIVKRLESLVAELCG